MHTNLTKTQLDSGDYYKEIWELDLFQCYEIDNCYSLRRVPGGWIFTEVPLDAQDIPIFTEANNTFIPYSEDFRPNKAPHVDRWFVD